MQAVVSAIWYRIYYWWMLVLSLVLGLLYLASHYVSKIQPHLVSLDLTSMTLILWAASVGYLVVGYWFIQKHNQGLAILIGAMFVTLVLLNQLHQNAPSSMANNVYLICWYINAIYSGILGITIVVGTVFIALLFVLLKSQFQYRLIDNNSRLLLVGTAVLAFSFYWLWRRLYRNSQTQQVGNLSSMLRTRQEQSEIILESIADGVVVFDTSFKVNLINSAAATLTGWTAKDATGIDIHQIMKLAKESGEALDKSADLFVNVLNTKTHYNQIFKLTGRQNTAATISLVISPVTIAPKNEVVGAVAIFRDVTKQRREDQQRVDFISTASHEMRTPVAAIEGYLALALNDKVSQIDSKARSFLEKAHQATEHLGKLFQDLLTSAKAEDGRLSNHPEVVDIGELIDQLTSDLKFAISKKNLEMEVMAGGSNFIDASRGSSNQVVRPLYYVYADPERLREVVTDLSDNAVKYTDSGKISIGLTGDDNFVQLFIRDTGPGIPAEDIPHLFQKFYRVDNTATRTVGGTGLGLFICRKIVELYNGRIWIESTVGQGSTFYINLPRLSAQKAEQLKAQEIATNDTTIPAAPQMPTSS
jgi:PAS domain S-box-containing protein